MTNSSMPLLTPAFKCRVDRETRRKKGPYLDGDTFIVMRLLAEEKNGLRLMQGDCHVRLLGLDSYEVDDPDPAIRALAWAAADRLRAWLEEAEASFKGPWPFVMVPMAMDSFGRFLVNFWDAASGASLNDYLLTQRTEDGEALYKVRSVQQQIREALA